MRERQQLFQWLVVYLRFGHEIQSGDQLHRIARRSGITRLARNVVQGGDKSVEVSSVIQIALGFVEVDLCLYPFIADPPGIAAISIRPSTDLDQRDRDISAFRRQLSCGRGGMLTAKTGFAPHSTFAQQDDSLSIATKAYARATRIHSHAGNVRRIIDRFIANLLNHAELIVADACRE